MPYPTQKVFEHPSTYVVQYLDNPDEMTRLDIQDKMLTTGMGGVLPEFADPTSLRRVLDVGCGTGGWLMEVAKTYPMIEWLVGADISSTILDYARAKAGPEHLGKRIQFQATDALRALPFRGGTFDLVNQRAGVGWLRKWDWNKILVEYYRVVRAGGIIRITEPGGIESNSPALTKLNSIGLEAGYNSGRLFTRSADGVTSHLEDLLTQHATQNIQTRVHTLVYRAGTEAGQYFCQDMALWFRVSLPFFQRWIRIPSDYQQTCQRALQEMNQPDFVATWTWVTVWGTKHLYGEPLLFMRGLR